MRVGPSTPIVPTCSPSTITGATTTEQTGERLDAVLGADGHGQAAVEDVAHQRHHDVLLLERAQHVAHRVDRVERTGHRRRAADEHRLVVAAGCAAPSRATAHSASTAASPDGRCRAGGSSAMPDHRAPAGGPTPPTSRASDVSASSSIVWLSMVPLLNTATTSRVPGRQADDLHRAHRGQLGARPDDDGRVLRDLREQVGGLVQQLLEPAVGGVEEGADALRRHACRAGRAW